MVLARRAILAACVGAEFAPIVTIIVVLGCVIDVGHDDALKASDDFVVVFSLDVFIDHGSQTWRAVRK